ncbi:hypothetical protein QVD17_14662 [Tagetes erecta]|uniref:Protein kinase domain-containing protein n=1 Tax=Tagetes erecta TaxID=13708 RepID=A0AAD8KUG9_TARER|nr:hypothetical protein QVD17_14662 [Tagetes erecta]
MAFDPIYLEENSNGLAYVARRRFDTRTLEGMIDPIIEGVTDEKGFIIRRGPNKNSLHTFIEIAYKCVAKPQHQRPTIKTVLKELEKALFFEESNKELEKTWELQEEGEQRPKTDETTNKFEKLQLLHQILIFDFGNSVFLPQNQEDEYLNFKFFGRPFYTDPEYAKTRKIKRALDVFSFAVVLFEILCGRLVNNLTHNMESFYAGSPDDIMYSIIEEQTSENNFLDGGANKDSLNTFLAIASQCIGETQDQRPTMKVVVKELEKALLFQNNNATPRFSFEDICQATQNFHNNNFIGEGGFGRVYKGAIQEGDLSKTFVAKRLDTRLGQGEQQFLSELQILLEYKHENVIGLIGYCDEKDEKIIVYEYASRGSLDRHLSNPSLTWMKRLNICIDVASALYFLHGGVGKQAKVIHRDIKTANILLNHDWKAKLADFGLSLISPLVQETDYVIDYACGTPGYLDPLYKISGFLTVESDIYSFGVVLFELLCGRTTFAIKKHDDHYLPEFIKNKFEEGKYDEVVFDQIREDIVSKSLTIFQEIAYQCLHLEREKRPTTKQVLMQLKKALKFQDEADCFLAPLAIQHCQNGTLHDIIPPNISNQMTPQSYFKYSKLAYSCLDEERAHSPDVENIVDILEKIADFSLALFLPPNQKDKALCLDTAVGTAFCIDPEYMMTGKLKRESDVYSFGVVMLEVLCGRIAHSSKEGDKGLAYMARQSYNTRTLEDMIDLIIKEETDENNSHFCTRPNKDSLHTFMEIAYQCVAETQDQRPSMKVVVKELEKSLLFQKNNKDNPKFSLGKSIKETLKMMTELIPPLGEKRRLRDGAMVEELRYLRCFRDKGGGGPVARSSGRGGDEERRERSRRGAAREVEMLIKDG